MLIHSLKIICCGKKYEEKNATKKKNVLQYFNVALYKGVNLYMYIFCCFCMKYEYSLELSHWDGLSKHLQSMLAVIPDLSPPEQVLLNFLCLFMPQRTLLLMAWLKVACTTQAAGGYKTFFSSAEHEIFSAKKYENAKNSWHFHSY